MILALLMTVTVFAGLYPQGAGGKTSLNAVDFFDRIVGEWHGEGQLFGQPAEFQMIWAWELDRNFVRLTYSIHGATEMEAIGHYRIVESEPLDGIWLDTRGEFVQLSPTLTGAGLETIWRSPTEKGRTTYEFTAMDSLEVRDYYHDGTDWQLFGTARYLRVPDVAP